METNDNRPWWIDAGFGATVSTIVVQDHAAIWFLLIAWIAWLVASKGDNDPS